MSVVWIAALSGIVFLGGAHGIIWFVLRTHRRAEAREGDASGGPGG